MSAAYGLVVRASYDKHKVWCSTLGSYNLEIHFEKFQKPWKVSKTAGSRSKRVFPVRPSHPVSSGSWLLSGFSSRPDRWPVRFAVQPVEPAGPVRFWKHWFRVKFHQGYIGKKNWTVLMMRQLNSRRACRERSNLAVVGMAVWQQDCTTAHELFMIICSWINKTFTAVYT